MASATVPVSAGALDIYDMGAAFNDGAAVPLPQRRRVRWADLRLGVVERAGSLERSTIAQLVDRPVVEPGDGDPALAGCARRSNELVVDVGHRGHDAGDPRRSCRRRSSSDEPEQQGRFNGFGRRTRWWCTAICGPRSSCLTSTSTTRPTSNLPGHPRPPRGRAAQVRHERRSLLGQLRRGASDGDPGRIEPPERSQTGPLDPVHPR